MPPYPHGALPSRRSLRLGLQYLRKSQFIDSYRALLQQSSNVSLAIALGTFVPELMHQLTANLVESRGVCLFGIEDPEYVPAVLEPDRLGRRIFAK
jgi:hypothetical protein